MATKTATKPTRNDDRTDAGPDVKNPHVRLIVRIVRTLLAADAFASLADLTDALKWTCGRLHIRVTPDDISDAFRLIASNTPLTTDTRRRRRPLERPIDPHPDLSRADAARLVQQLLDGR